MDINLIQQSSSLTTWKDVTAIIQSIVTAAAFVTAGIWTYILFVKKRHPYPHANVTHKLIHKNLPNRKTLLNLQLHIANTGDTLLSIVSVETRVQQMLPLAKNIAECIDKGEDPVTGDMTECGWPLINQRNTEWENGNCIIEPGENEPICYDFILDEEVKTVVVYSHVMNSKEKGIGWNITTIYDVK